MDPENAKRRTIIWAAWMGVIHEQTHAFMNSDIKLLVGRLVSTFLYARIEDPILEWRSILKNYLFFAFLCWTSL